MALCAVASSSFPSKKPFFYTTALAGQLARAVHFFAMKKVAALFILLLFAGRTLCAQGKEDYTWVLGYPNDPPTEIHPLVGGSLLSFKNGPPDTSRFVTGAGMTMSASISDDKGDLLFYSNGCEVFNAKHQIMPNGDAINFGVGYDATCATPLKRYNLFQGVLALPWPQRPNQYKLFHIRWLQPYKLENEMLTTTIDMALDGGMGSVTEKNHPIALLDTFNVRMTAVRHGNGRDWFIVASKHKSTKYHTFLFDSVGVHELALQDVGGLYSAGGHGQAAFSPDGSKYAEATLFQGQLMDFDRCTGHFSNPRKIEFNTDDNISAGVAFSPNSRYLYVTRYDTLYQYDLSAPDFNQSRTAIAGYEKFFDPMGPSGLSFYTMLLAPDNKIYMSVGSNARYWHVIHDPDQKGTACDFRQHDLLLPTLHYYQTPNLPHFRLGAMNPPCGTSGIVEPEAMPKLNLSPNPATDHIEIKASEHLPYPIIFQMFDAMGRLLLEKKVEHLPAQVDLSSLPAAAYFYRFTGDGGKFLGNGSLTKMPE